LPLPFFLVGTHAVKGAGHVAVETERLKAGREPTTHEPSVQDVPADTVQVSLAMFGPVVVDVIDGQELLNRLAATRTGPPVVGEHLRPRLAASFSVSLAGTLFGYTVVRHAVSIHGVGVFRADRVVTHPVGPSHYRTPRSTINVSADAGSA
jgi:hypothetical protein